MKRQVIIRPEAALEVQETFNWYAERSEGLGLEFLRAADAGLSAVQRTPFAFPVVHEQARRAILRKFPYFLLYLVEQDRIVVLACFHTKRDPIDWLRRVQP